VGVECKEYGSFSSEYLRDIKNTNENLKIHGSSFLSQEELTYAEMSCQF